jgi:hypothetical protein
VKNGSSCRRTGPTDGQGCGLRFGLKVTHFGHCYSARSVRCTRSIGGTEAGRGPFERAITHPFE